MGLITVQIQNGLGRPAYYLSEHQLQVFMKYSYGEWLQVRSSQELMEYNLRFVQTFATLTFTKISICLFLLRITITKAFIRPLYAAIFVLAVSNVVLSLTWILQCRPHLDKAWNTKMPGVCFTKGQLERIIISQASKSTIASRTHRSVLTLSSHIDHLGLFPLRLSHPHLTQSTDKLPE